MKKSEIKKLDKIWAEKVKERANYICEWCLETDVWLNSAHILGRRYRGTRWLLMNGLCLCYGCHRKYDEHAPEAEQIRRVLIGKERMDKLLAIKQGVTKNQDFEEIKRTLLEAYKEMSK